MTIGRKDDARLAVRLGRLGANDSVVDIGCGPGVAVRHAARLGARVTGVDPAPVMLRVARLVTPLRANVRYLQGAAESIPLSEGSASVAWSIATVHHWADIDSGLRELRRVLLPGGRLVAMERRTTLGAHGHESHGWTDEQAAGFAERCRDHGFLDVRVNPATVGRRSTISVVACTP
jgi:ubiquinone/menaquinone biosynthesis C-methylase UbiE